MTDARRPEGADRRVDDRALAIRSTASSPRPDWSRWAGVVLTALLAVLAFTVQWGVVTAKLDHVEKRLDELIVEARALRSEYQAIERRVSYLEGRQNGLPDPARPAGGRQAGRTPP
ncbi:MAG: hypothetical protein HRF50_16160 [Phycisphaerae bacterium]|jgi:hypothetical protein